MPLAAVLSRHAITCRRATQAFVAAGLEVVQCESPHWGPGDRARARIVLLDLDLEPATPPGALVERTARTYPGVPIVAVAGVRASERLLGALAHGAVGHVIPKRGTARAPGLVAVEELRGTAWPDEHALYTLARRRLGAAPGLSGFFLAGTAIHAHVLVRSGARTAALSELERFVGRLALPRDHARRCRLVADELVMNGLFDAPRDAAGEPLHRPSGPEVVLDAAHPVTLSYACDGQTVAVSVRDSFGTLSRARVVERLGRIGDPDLAPAEGPGGAGLGLLMVHASSSQLLFQLTPGRATEVIATLRISGSAREAQLVGTSIHLEEPVTTRTD